MPAFDYSAYNSQGKLVSGVIAADSERHARRQLKENRLLPASVAPVREKQRRGLAAALPGRGVNNFDLSLLLRQQAILINSGLPLEEALRMTVEQAGTEKQRRLVQSWRTEIVEGRSFSEALRRSPYRIPESVIAGVGVGEESGHLHEVLNRLADEIEVSAENRKTFSRALMYPAALVVTSMIVVSIMMVWVVPKITVVFAHSGRQLPLITRFVVGLSEFLQRYGLYLAAAAALFLGAVYWLLRDPDRRIRWHRLQLRLPGVGRWLLMSNIADWSRSLGILLQTGVPALAALRIAAQVVGNLYLRQKMEAVTESMRRGSSLHSALQEQQVGSGFLVHMVGSGEASSSLDAMLLRVADYYSARLKNAVEVFLKLINPLLIVFMGMVILGIVAAVMLPIMDMNNML